MATSILDRAQPLTTLTTAGGFVWIIYGKAGVGKTTLAATIADGADPGTVLFVSTDRSLQAVAHRADIAGLAPESWDELGAIYTALAAGSPYRTVVIDTLSEAISLCHEAVLKESGHKTPTTDDYAAVNKRVIALIRRFRDLAYTRQMHVIFTAWENETDVEDEGRKFTRIQPDFSARIAQYAPAAVDAVMRLAIIRDAAGKPKRVLTLTSQPNVLTKFRAPATIRVPERLEEPTLPTLVALLTAKETK